MNILYLTNHLNVGGITSYILTLSTGLKKRGHNIYIASSPGKILYKFIEENISYIPIPIKTKKEVSVKILLSYFKLTRVVKEYDIDIVHSNSRTTQVLGCLLSRSARVVHVSTCHGFFKRRFLRRIFPCWGKRVIAISQQVKEHLIEDFKLEAEKIVVINNGIDIAKFETRNPKSETRKEFGLNDAPVIGIVARLSDVKGHIYLIDAMKNVLDNFPSAQLLIVGEGKMKDELVKRIEKIGITKNVFFIPEVSETKDALSVMDIFVMPSLKEGLGLSLMEAMASGLPVIGSDVGGIRTLIQSEVNGLLVKPADAESLSGAIIELLSNQKKREFLGNNARMFISQNFSEGKMVDETERLYQECLNIKD